MFKSKKGAALMQVLLVTVILAGIAAMLLRASLSRSTSARKTRREATAEVLIQSCMAEVNSFFAQLPPETFARNLRGGFMYCPLSTENDVNLDCTDKNGVDQSVKQYTCAPRKILESDPGYVVTASFDEKRNIVYELNVDDNSNNDTL